MYRHSTFLGLAFVLLLCLVSYAAVPPLINFQGILKDGSGNPVANASYSVVFSIYDMPTGGSALWTETQSVSTTSGLFAVLLGSTNPVPDSAFKGANRWLGIKVSADPEMTPRQQLVSLGYAYRVSSVDSASGGTITSKVSIGPGHVNTGTNAFAAGENNRARGNYSVVSGGGGPSAADSNATNGDWSTVSGGRHNTASGIGSTVGGGGYDGISGVGGNTASGAGSVVGGGNYNVASGTSNVIGGGFQNQTSNSDALIAGGSFNTASNLQATVGGGAGNTASGIRTTVSGGADNTASDTTATVGGGRFNAALARHSTIGGGMADTITSGGWCTIGGGYGNFASNFNSTVGGGSVNRATGVNSTVAGGQFNIANNWSSTIGGGQYDTASGLYATVPGGYANKALGSYAFAAGQRAKAVHSGAFVWADGTDADFASTAGNQFLIRASGGVGIGTNNPSEQLTVAGSMEIGTGAGDYQHLRIGGGNSSGFLYGSYPAYGDGIHLGYNYYANGAGAGIIPNAGGGTSRITLGYGYIGMYGGYAGFAPLFLGVFVGEIGYVGIRTSSPSYPLDVAGSAHATSFPTSSDNRLKKNIEPLTGVLEKIDKIHGVSFDWNETYEKMGRSSGHREIGFIAQDVEAVFPELVTKWGNKDYRAVDYGRMTAVLLEAVKELKTENKELKNRISALEKNGPQAKIEE